MRFCRRAQFCRRCGPFGRGAHGRDDAESWPRRRRSVGHGCRGPRTSAPEDHRPLRRRRSADGRRRAGTDDRLQRLHLQPPRIAARAGTRRLSVLLAQRHRGDPEGLRPLGRAVRRAAVRDVRLCAVRSRPAPAHPGARPARHQAALPLSGSRLRTVRLDASGAAGGRGRGHGDRPRRAASLLQLARRGSGSLHDPEGGAQARARHRDDRRGGRGERRSTPTGRPITAAVRSAPDGRRRTGRGRCSGRSRPRCGGAWSPTCRWACCCPAVWTRA